MATGIRRGEQTAGGKQIKPSQVFRQVAPPGSSRRSLAPKTVAVGPPADVMEISKPSLPASEADALDALWAAKKYKQLVPQLDTLVRAVSTGEVSKLKPEQVAEKLELAFVLQHRLIAVLNKLSMVDAPDAKKQALELLKQVTTRESSLFEASDQLLRVQHPNAAQPQVVYRNTFKKPKFITPTEAEQAYLTRLQRFAELGGELSLIKPMNAAFLKAVKSNQFCEFVVNDHDVARVAVSEGKFQPGHTLLSGGADALSAGTFRVFKNDKGEITQVVVGTYSGHFLAPVESLAHFARHLVASGVPAEKITFQAGEAAGGTSIELIHLVTGKSGAESQRRRTELQAEAYRWSGFEIDTVKPIDLTGPAPSERSAGALFAEAKAVLDKMVKAKVAADGIVTGPEAKALAGQLTQVLLLSQEAGVPQAYRDAQAMTKHLASQTAPVVDEQAASIFSALAAEWEKKPFGRSARDPADLFSPPPIGRRTRVVATVNPKATQALLREMIVAGMDVARINGAHGSIDEQRELIKRTRLAAAEAGKPITIQLDLAGPKIRLGKFANPEKKELNDIFLAAGSKVTLTSANVLGNAALLPVELPDMANAIQAGDPIFLNDGLVELKATAVSTDDASGEVTVQAEVVLGGKVWDRKGVNLPKLRTYIAAFTEEDRTRLLALLPGLDLVAPSFVSRPEDVLMLRSEMAKAGRPLPILAKIETREAVDQLEAIAQVADGLMVARGDLGVEIGWENVPVVERRINALGNRLGKATMVATEVLMSMVGQDRPTRGEVDGAYSAIEQGAESLMLGKESSFQERGAETVRAVVRLIEQAERDQTQESYR